MLGALVYAPYGVLLAYFFPIRVLGVSFVASIIPAALLAAAAVSLRGSPRRDSLRVAGLLALGLLMVGALRVAIGDQNVRWTTCRFLVLIPLWIRVAKWNLADQSNQETTKRVLLTHGLIFASIGIAYRLGIISLRLTFGPDGQPLRADPLNAVVTRSSGLFANPNAFGAMLLVVIFLAVFTVFKERTLRGAAIIGSSLAALLGTGSRWSIIGASILLVAGLMIGEQRHGRQHRIPLRWGAILVIFVFALPESSTTTRRFAENAPRINKSALGASALTRAPDTWLAGAHDDDLIPHGNEERAFSDNGWLQMPISVGIPLFLAMFVNSWSALHLRGRPRLPWPSRVGLLLVAGTMLLNNANLWDPWLAWMIASYWIVTYGALRSSEEAPTAWELDEGTSP